MFISKTVILSCRKTRHSAFIRTDLESILWSHGIESVVICGYSTNACVGLTTIEAYERDFKIMLAGDAILGTNPSEHALMLDYLWTRFGVKPVSNREILKTIDEILPTQ